MAKDVTMQDIAKELGISTVSVSKALTDKDGVSSEMRATIKRKAEEMGYRYSVTKSGKEGKNLNIGVLVEDHFIKDQTSAFYFKMYQSIIMKLPKNNYSGILEILTQDKIKSGVLPQIITDKKVDGVIALGKIESRYLRSLRETGIPIVYLDYYDRHMEVPSVTTDNVYGTYMLMNHIVRMGHRKIAFVGDIEATPSILDRYLGYMRGLIVNNINVPADYLICDRDAEGNYIEMKMPEDMPTAIVCNCDHVALFLIENLKKLGYRVPEDVSVVGFDNSPFAEFSDPKLTTVEVDVDTMTETACDLLVSMIRGEKNIHGRKVISGRLIIRDSVKKLAY